MGQALAVGGKMSPLYPCSPRSSWYVLYSSGSGAIATEKDVRSAGEHSCQICFEHDHSTAMLPCGHGGVCWECGLQIYALTQECPMCRVTIEVVSATVVFHSNIEY